MRRISVNLRTRSIFLDTVYEDVMSGEVYLMFEHQLVMSQGRLD